MAASAFLTPASGIVPSRGHQPINTASAMAFEAAAPPRLISNSSSSTWPLAIAVVAFTASASRRRTRAKATRRPRGIAEAVQQNVAVELRSDWVVTGPAGDAAADFPFPHWLWHHEPITAWDGRNHI